MERLAAMTMLAAPPEGLKRALFRAPIWVYRAHLGFLFGHRLVYLATRGRRSGLRRDVVVEVTEYNALAGKLVVMSGWGAASDWYRNLRAGPAVAIRLATRTYPAPPHHFLDHDQAAMLLDRYRRAHPWTWRQLAASMGLPRNPDDVQLEAAASQLRAVAFDLKQRPQMTIPPTATAS